MYEEHDVFRQPAIESVKVWRYMDFTKLVALMESRCLYFTRADKFEDPFEGSWPKFNVKARLEIPDEVPANMHKKYLESMQGLGGINKQWPRYTAINCWHMNEYESAAMWKLYLKSDEGITIQSTYSRLKESLVDKSPVFLGTVSYIDYDVEPIDPSNVLNAFMHKRKSFEHEREVRAVIATIPLSNGVLDFEKETMNHGMNIDVDLEKLVERIYVAPNAPSWFRELIEAVVSRYELAFKVTQSMLNESPVF